MSVRLDARLATVARWVPRGARVVDLGTDHGLLPVALMQTGCIDRLIATDRMQKPLDAAARTIEAAGLSASIELRLGEGLEVVTPGEVDVVTFAGVGGGTIARVLTAARDVLAQVRRIVVQPIEGEVKCRAWGRAGGFRLLAEEAVEAEGRVYEVLVFEPGDAEDGYRDRDPEVAEMAGPHLTARRDPLAAERWSGRRVWLIDLLQSLNRAGSPRSRAAAARIRDQLGLVERICAAFQTPDEIDLRDTPTSGR